MNLALLVLIGTTSANVLFAIRFKTPAASKLNWALAGYGLGQLMSLAMQGAHLSFL
ncbi:TPA: hypothetical protein JG832_002439 [Enterobacter hormaechei subsp. xiangfangensis]|nr:hypothetical protein [Enterobacter hormaechei subsp. xiangfangensis]HAV1890575.1 hypothetical protein [Enterobacter hormaechei subsp. xiangfangensis]